ncbi:hypothetical protein ACFXP7_01700 [Microbacterium sp. P06]|uniref:beta family protein n=1 Tax=Microbacterium sp. P06 TaxID=3366949 RepID=UPI0037462D82
MATNEVYVPIVKAREAELLALRRKPRSLQVTPYFELQNVGSPTVDPVTGLPKRTKSAVTDASYFLDDVTRLWGEDFYLDVSRVAAHADRATWWHLLAALSALNPNAVVFPALAESDSSGAWAAAAPIATRSGRAAMRVSLPHPNPSNIAARLAVASAALTIPASQIDVVLDWGDQMEAGTISLDTLVLSTRAAMAGLGPDHGRVITAGTPNSDAFVQVGYWHPVRREWWLWLRMQASGADVVYGDYVLYPPSDPVPASPRYGHLRYSSGDELHVHRTAIPSAGGGLKAAFTQCCVDVTASPYFLGSSYSSADAEMDEIARGISEQGAAGAWRRLAAIHHFAVVADQLASPPSPPPAGTP